MTGKRAIQVPRVLAELGEMQRMGDIRAAELAVVRHKARGASDPGYPIRVTPRSTHWPRVYAWMAHASGGKTSRADGISLLEMPAQGGGTAWHVEAVSQGTVLYREVIPAARFLDSWKGM